MPNTNKEKINGFTLLIVAKNHIEKYAKLKWWQIKEKKKLEIIMFADYLANTNRIQQACDYLEVNLK